jgi:ATP-dependent helicase/nuclease subunit A
MPEKQVNWTDQQLRAIRQRGRDVLVSASAGTGKTQVLSGRCASIVSAGCDIWNILVLTFTDMAAEQMRSRIAEQLRAGFLRTADAHLRRQLVLLQGADISTIHAFCKRLITEHFYELDLDPTFSVIDADEAKLLKAEALEETIDRAWQQSRLQQALASLLYRRDLRTNDGFLARILELSDFLDGVVSRENWLQRASRLAEIANPLTSELGQRQKQIVSDRLHDILQQLRHARMLYEKEIPNGDWARYFEDAFIKPVARCVELLQAGNWDACAQQIRSFTKPTFHRPKELLETTAELISKTRERAVKSMIELASLAVVNPDYLDRLGDSVSLQTSVLIELAKTFDAVYSRAKRTLNCLDFADLEHHALKLLTAKDSPEDKPLPSAAALTLRQKYKYIFVDEYQDINTVQQQILDRLSAGRNILEVGDIKQSIYGFRGAEPAIFLEHLESASVDPKNLAAGLRVDLNVNFRSARGILDFVNKIFSRIMTAAFANIDYDEAAQLRPGLQLAAALSQGQETVVEFHILDEADTDSQNDAATEPPSDEDIGVVSSRQRQAAMIARRIRQMVGAETGKAEFQVYDKHQDKFRDVQYRDIVILMRSLARKANDYVEVLRLAGLPVSCQSSAGYFETTEITDMVTLLKVLDNPQRDIELAAVLRSPFFKVSDTELAKIRLDAATDRRGTDFYSRVLRYSTCGADADLASKFEAVLGQIERWRTVARRGHLADLLWQIYRQTGFLSFVSALPNGQARRANLLNLHDRAIQFEGFVSSAGIPSLRRFVEFIERLQEIGQDWTPAEPEAAAGNAVRILSVHKSKGLEFPVVFLAELESKFNKKDVYADVLADAENTLGLQIVDRRSNSKLSSLAHQVIAEEKLSKALAEELRILYVATTRARDRLILTASQRQTRCGDIVRDGFHFGSEPVPDWQLRSCQNPLEWVLYGLSDQKVLHDAFQTELMANARDDDLFNLRVYGRQELEQLSRFVLSLRAGKLAPQHLEDRPDRKPKPARSSLLSRLKESLAWQYRYGDVPTLPAKQSVTELTHRSDEYVRFDYSRALERQPKALVAAEAGVTEPLEGRLIGTATHAVLARLDLSQPITVEAIEKTVGRLVADGAIGSAVAEHIDIESILAFFQSELGRMALEPDNTVWREWPFTIALDVGWAVPTISGLVCGAHPTSDERPVRLRSELALSLPKGQAEATTDEVIVVQGIIDMLIQTPRGLIVIDFKTDKVTAQQVAERAELYRGQLELYSRAAEAILRSEILGRWLYFLTPRASIPV